MRVIKHGEAKGNLDWRKWAAKVVCKKRDKYDPDGCGAELEVGFKDLIWMYWEGTHSRHNYPAIRCPDCGKYNAVKNVPTPILERLAKESPICGAVFDGFSEAL